MSNKARQTIFISVLIVVLCVVLSVGITFAFFADSAASSSNKVQSGRLKVDFEILAKGTTDTWNSIKKDKDPIFSDTLWEPGYTDVKILRVRNIGTLAINWEARYVSETEITAIADVIDVYIVQSADPIAYPTEREELENWGEPITLTAFIEDISSVLKGTLQASESAYFGIALRMRPGIGDQYQGMILGEFDLNILASQVNFETDAFGPDYDKDASYPCDHSVTETITGSPATCTSTGLTDGTKCSVCKEILVAQEVIPTSGHTESDWIIDVEPTYITEGHKYTECTVCGETMQEATIDALPYSEGLEYELVEDAENGNYYKVVGMGTYSGTDVIIPDVHTEDGTNYLPVKVVGDGTNPFKDGTSVTSAGITSVSIPNSVTTISANAFQNCTSLASVTFGDGSQTVSTYSLRSSNSGSQLTTIGNYAFGGCAALANITIPDSVTTIGTYTFQNCTSLASVTFGKDNQLKTVGDDAFTGCEKLEAVHIESLQSWCKIDFSKIGSSNPLMCAHNLYLNGELITELVIPDDVTYVGVFSFAGCTPLTSAVIPDSVTQIRHGIFHGCGNIESLKLPFVGRFGTEVSGYDYKNPLGWIFYKYEYDGGVPTVQKQYTSLTTYDYKAYIPAKLKSLTITGGEIPAYAFQNCTGIESITLLNSPTSIGSYAFQNCDALTSIKIPDSVEIIGGSAFEGCTKLANVTIGNSVTTINYNAFNNCTALTSITIPDSVTTIDDHAFHYCTGLQTVTFGKNSQLTFSGCFAFIGCTNITDVYVTNVESWASLIVDNTDYNSRMDGEETALPNAYGKLHILDENGNEITELVIPESVTHIALGVFNNACNLTSITVPNSVTFINQYAFRGCGSLESITFEGTIEQWNAITKCSAWNEDTGKYTIYCTDGEITKAGVTTMYPTE